MVIRSVDELSSLGRRIILFSRIIFCAVAVSSLHRTRVGIGQSYTVSGKENISFKYRLFEENDDNTIQYQWLLNYTCRQTTCITNSTLVSSYFF